MIDFGPRDCSNDHQQDQSDSTKTSNNIESPKELCKHLKIRFRVRGGGPCVLEGISFQGDKSFWQKGEVETKIHQIV